MLLEVARLAFGTNSSISSTYHCHHIRSGLTDLVTNIKMSDSSSITVTLPSVVTGIVPSTIQYKDQ